MSLLELEQMDCRTIWTEGPDEGRHAASGARVHGAGMPRRVEPGLPRAETWANGARELPVRATPKRRAVVLP